MRTIAVICQKGGVGKTTLAINLAGAAEAAGLKAVIVDLDPQASAKDWHDHRAARESPVVISSQAARLADVLAIARSHGADVCLIDTAPKLTDDALKAAKVADLVLIPCRPSVLDLNAVALTAEAATFAHRSALFVLNGIRPGDKSLPDQAEEALAAYPIPVATTRISQRVAFVHSLTAWQTVEEYEPEGPAAREIRDLFTLACQHADIVGQGGVSR